MKNFRNTRHWLLALLLGCFAISAQAFVEGSDTFGSGTIADIEPGEYYIYFTDRSGADHFLYANDGTWMLSSTPQAITISRGNIGESDGYAPYARTSALMDSNGYRMTNPSQSHLRTEPTSRSRTFESQVFYSDGIQYAIRITNVATSSWYADSFVNIEPCDLTLSAESYNLGDVLYIWNVTNVDSYGIDNDNLEIITAQAMAYIASHPTIQCDVLTALQEQISNPTNIATLRQALEDFKWYYYYTCILRSLVESIDKQHEVTTTLIDILDDVHSTTEDLELAYQYLLHTDGVPFGGERTGEISWKYNETTKVLTLWGAGNGHMSDFSSSSCPWRGYANQIQVVIILDGVTSIGSFAFDGCSNLISITLPEGVTSIGESAFGNCSSLASITIPKGVTSIGGSAFSDCSSLASITIPEGVTSIGSFAFDGCSNLASIILPESLTSIGGTAFQGCNNLVSIVIPDGVTSIGFYAFHGCYNIASITILGNNVPTYTLEQLERTDASVYVAAGMYDEYMADERWAPYSKNIVSADMLELRTVEVTAKVGVSAIDEQIGEANRLSVGNLKVCGTINNYDIFAIRTKFLHLRDLDLSEADIVASDDHFQYYSGYYLTEDNQLGDFAFYDLDLRSVILPNSLKSIGSYAFSNCKQLTTITLPDSVQSMGSYSFEYCSSLVSITLSENLADIPSNAFYCCSSLAAIVIPNSVKSIGDEAFRGCSNLSSVSVGSSVESIGRYAFGYSYSSDYACRKLTHITLPTSVKTVGEGAFGYSSLTELRIPSSVRTIGEQAFAGCPLTDIYTYIVEPQQINQNTFDVYTTAMLHVPSTSWALYDYNTQWGQFVNKTYFDEPYEYFYIDHDYTLDDATGRIDGDPDAELNEHSGLIVEGDDEQGLTDIDINHDGTDGPSIIADDNVTAESMTIHITLNGRSWKFFCFPYDIEYSDIRLVPSNDQFAGEIAMYTYNGALRALGQSGWVRVDPSETLIAGRGYIIQGSTNGTLDITIREENLDFSADDKAQEMEAFAASDDADASWNFMGNPYLSYYDLDALSEQFDSPITIWDGNQYLAYRPGDDNYQLHPFEAFFVQKPEKLPDIEFKGNNRITYTGAQSTGAANAARRRMASVNADRLLVNLTLTDGTVTDKTRVVFNEKASAAYERECDAAKFMSLNDVPQLWTLSGKTQYAINERPTDDGIVTLAYTATQEGTLTLRATRMDTPMVLCDRMTGTEFDLREGDYTFLTEAGTFTDRFTLRRTAATAIGNAMVNDEEDLQRFNAAGQAADADTKGVMILKQGDKVVKRYNK